MNATNKPFLKLDHSARSQLHEHAPHQTDLFFSTTNNNGYEILNHSTVLTTSTEIIRGTRKCGPCQGRVFIYLK